MSIRHHLSDQLLMAYAAAGLPEAFSLVIATHVSLCDDCRARLESFDAVGGALVDIGEEASMGADAVAAMKKLGTIGDPGFDIGRHPVELFL